MSSFFELLGTRLGISLPPRGWALLTFLLGTQLQVFAWAASTTTTLAVTPSGSSVTAGTVVTLTAAVNIGSTVLTTGQVNFCDAMAASCSDIHLLATAQLTSAGTATYKFIPGPGHHSYQAVFLPTTTHATSSSKPAALNVTAPGLYPTKTTIASAGSAGNYTLSATVTGGSTAPSTALTGNISFLDTNHGNASLATAALGSSTAGLIFLNPSNPATGSEPSSVVSGDFNGDGKTDLIVANSAANTLTVLLGNGHGSFTATRTSPATGHAPGPMGVGDFNNDGKQDLAVANTSDNTVTILIGNGDGTFHAAASLATAYTPYSLIVKDFDRDGEVDLAVATLAPPVQRGLSNGQVTIMHGKGDGTFTTGPTTSVSAPNAYPLAAGDFNGDGIPDLAAISDASFQPQVFFLLGKGDGTFTVGSPWVTDSFPVSLAAADFDGGGKAELAVLNTDTHIVSILTLNADGTVADYDVSFPVSRDPTSLVVGDFNGDGNADLAAPNTFDDTVTVLEGSGNGAFPIMSNVTTSANAAYTFLAAADFNGDGVSDFALSGSSVNSLEILLPQPTQAATAMATGVSPTGIGTHNVLASYPGNATYSASRSTTVALTGVPTAPITFSVPNHTYGDAPFLLQATSSSAGAFTYSVISGRAMVSGAEVTLTGAGTVVLQAAQAASGAYGPSTQTASFTVRPAPLAIAAANTNRVFGAANPAFTGTITGALDGDIFSETFSTVATTASIVGSYAIVPAVTGANIASYTVTATNGILTVSQVGTTTTFALSNANKTLTAAVASLTSGSPTGTVAFYEGQTKIGMGAVSNGTASYTTQSVPAANVVVSTQYSGDPNFTESASPPILLLSLLPTNTSITIPASGTITDTVSIAPAPGFSGTFQLSCGNLPANATCSFQPSSIAFTGSTGAASTSVTIQTGATAQAQRTPPGAEQPLASNLAAVFWIPGLLTALFAGRSYGKSALLLLLLGVMGATLSACGGGSTKATPVQSQTQAGAYSVQIIATGSGGLSQSTAVMLTVQ